jgi:hypothetical protein
LVGTLLLIVTLGKQRVEVIEERLANDILGLLRTIYARERDAWRTSTSIVAAIVEEVVVTHFAISAVHGRIPDHANTLLPAVRERTSAELVRELIIGGVALLLHRIEMIEEFAADEIMSLLCAIDARERDAWRLEHKRRDRCRRGSCCSIFCDFYCLRWIPR